MVKRTAERNYVNIHFSDFPEEKKTARLLFHLFLNQAVGNPLAKATRRAGHQVVEHIRQDLSSHLSELLGEPFDAATGNNFMTSSQS